MATGDKNKLQSSWHDTSWIPVLNQYNVMEYFSQRSNPFYDRTCNNEIIRMQRADTSQLASMIGIEYSLLIVQEPILYVVRKVHRHSPDKVTPLADYYVLAGVVYQCPDLQSIINSRMLSTIHLTHQAFEEALSYVHYDPSTGYNWKFPGESAEEKEAKSKAANDAQPDVNEQQRKRVDNLLMEMVKRYPVKTVLPKEGGKPVGVGGSTPRGAGGPTNTDGSGLVKRVMTTSDNKPPDLKRKRP